jgi:hypothetical protein
MRKYASFKIEDFLTSLDRDMLKKIAEEPTLGE